MAYRLAGKRIPVTVGELTVEVQEIASDTVYRTVVGLGSACLEAEGAARGGLLERLASLFCYEAQPTWEIVDHRGAVPATLDGMARLPDTLLLELVSEWAATFVAEPPETAVDKMVPPGPMRDELNRRLRAVA